MLTVLHKYPFLRILLPFAIGIASGEPLSAISYISSRITAGVLIGGIPVIIILYLLKSFRFRWFFGIFLCGFLFSAGILFYHLHLHKVFYSWPAGEQFYVARLMDDAAEKEKSLLFRVFVESRFQSDSSLPVNRKTLLYLAKDSLAFQLRPGDRIIFQAVMATPKNKGNPEEFDYARFLRNRGISATAYVPSGKWLKADHPGESFFASFSRSSRKRVVQLYRDNGIEGQELAVLSAITIGYKEELSEDIRESYSVAGGSHILALSGLHIGVIAAVFSFLLSLPIRSRYAGALKKIIVLLLLWGYAMVAGMSPSIVRAVIMFSVVTLSYYPWYPHFALNTLAATAFGMLIYNPFYLFDVGFQLSFAAVAAILLIYPRLEKCVSRSSRILRYLWGLIAVSLAAQIGTLPLILFYFSRFSSYFLLTNLLIVLPASGLLYLFILFLAATPFPAVQGIVATLMQYITWFMNSMVKGVEKLPHASMDNWVLTPWEVLLIYLIVFLGLLYRRGSRSSLLAAIFTLFILVAGYLYSYIKEPLSPAIVFYNNREAPAVHFIASRNRSYLVSNVPEEFPEKLKYAGERYWKRIRLNTILPVSYSYQDDEIFCRDGLVCFRGRTLLFAEVLSSKKYTGCELPDIDYLYVTVGFTGSLKKLSAIIQVREIVLDASLPVWRIRQFKEECYQIRIPVRVLSEKGAWHISL